MLAESREQALQRMIAKGKDLYADGIVKIRFQTSMIMKFTAEVLVYGTVVKLQKI